MANERREYPRYKKTIPIKIHSPVSESRIETLDVSLGGAAIYYTHKFYYNDDIIRIELILLDEESIICEAKVVWIYPRTRDAGLYTLGLEFQEMSERDKERLLAFIESS